MKNQQLAQDIIGFLRQSIADGSVSSDDKESLEVAIECIADSFGVESAEASTTLADLYASNTRSTPISTSSWQTTAPADVAPEVPASVEVSEEDRELADKLKLEGNRHMAQKNYPQAIESYSEAILKNPTNALYYSNRAAAYSQANQAQRAVDDARRAVELDPAYAKGYSRLGLALYSIGDLKGSLQAYEDGLIAEGSSPSEGMRRGYETVKKRIEETGSGSVTPKGDGMTESEKAAASSSLGGEGAGLFGGMPNFGSLGEIMNNPEIRKMAQNLMSNPSAMSDILNNPTAQRVRESFANGQTPNFSELMSDPNLTSMMNSYMNSGDKNN